MFYFPLSTMAAFQGLTLLFGEYSNFFRGVLAALGIIYAPQLQVLGGGLQNQFIVGYLIVAIFCILFHYMTKNREKA